MKNRGLMFVLGTVAFLVAACSVCGKGATEATTEKTAKEQSKESEKGEKDYSHVVSDAWNSFLNLADSAIESVMDATEEWRGKAMEAWEEAQGYVEEYLEKVPGWIDEGTKFLQEKSEELSKNVGSAWETLMEGAQEVGSHTQEEIEEAKEEMEAWMDEFADSAEDAEALEAVQKTIDMAEMQLQLWAAKLSLAEEFFSDKDLGADEAILAAWKVVKEGYEEAGSHTVEEIKKAKETLEDYLSEKKEISEDIVESVKDLAESAQALAENTKALVK